MDIGLFVFIENKIPSREEIDAIARKKGKKVSGLRRITLFFLDAFLFFFYYGCIPFLLKQKTLGSLFLNIKIKSQNIFLFLARTVVLYLYYFYLPLFIFWGTKKVVRSSLECIYFGEILFFLFFYGIHFIVLLSTKKLYYDKLFPLEYISTIKE